MTVAPGNDALRLGGIPAWHSYHGAGQLGKDKPGGVEAMNELAETGVSGIIVPDDHELEKWRVYFQGRLTAPRFSSRTDAMGYLGVLRSGNRKPEFALAYEGKEIR